MLRMNNTNDIEKMRRYYRTSDMINLLEHFPEISPIRNLTIVENELDFINNKEEIDSFEGNRVDSLKGRQLITGLDNDGRNKELLSMLRQIKVIDPYGVLVLFNVTIPQSERYERYAGISVGVALGEAVYIDAVGKGFDGRELSKGICTHERYFIPWFELRKCCIENFKQYQTYEINERDYRETRFNRIEFLKSLNLNPIIFEKYIPENYEPIPDFIWLNVIKGILKKLEKREEILLNSDFTNFAISGHTEGKEFCPWQMFDKNRFVLAKKLNK